MTTAPDLPAFLLARYAEDEAVALRAREAVGPRSLGHVAVGDWTVYSYDYEGIVVTDKGVDPTDVDNDETDTDPTTVHIARHDPARVLADCAAKRQILALATASVYPRQTLMDRLVGPSIDMAWQAGIGHVLRWLAVPYVGHEDYRPEWKP